MQVSDRADRDARTRGTASQVRLALCAPGEIWGGVEQFVESLSAHLARSGRPVVVLLLFDGAPRTRIERLGIPVMTVGGSARYDPSAIIRIVRALRDHRINVLHTHGYKASVLGAVAARFSGGVRVVRTEHGRIEPWQGPARLKMKINAALERVASDWLADAVAYVSEDIRQRAAGVQDPPRRQVIYNGIDLSLGDRVEAAPPLEDHPGLFNIGIVGRVAPVKGHLFLLRALTELRHLPSVRLHIFGTGPLEAECRQFADANALSGAVHFLGFTPHVSAYMRQLDLLVMPSIHEGLPYTLLEAMCLRVPVVASSVGGLAEVLEDGVTAALVPPANPARLAEAIERLYHHPGRRQALATAAYELVSRRFTIEEMARRYWDVYENVLSN